MEQDRVELHYTGFNMITNSQLTNVLGFLLRGISHSNEDLIGSYHFWEISSRNSTSFTRPFLARRCTWAGHETNHVLPQMVDPLLSQLANAHTVPKLFFENNFQFIKYLTVTLTVKLTDMQHLYMSPHSHHSHTTQV